MFFKRFFSMEKCGVTPNCLYRDSSSNRLRTLGAPKLVPKNSTVKIFLLTDAVC